MLVDVGGCWWMLVDVGGCWWMLVDVGGCWWMWILKHVGLPSYHPVFCYPRPLIFWGVTKSGPHQAMASHALLWPPNSAGSCRGIRGKGVFFRASEVISLLNSGMLTSWKVVSVPCQSASRVGLFCGLTVLGLAFDKRPRTGGDRGVGWMVPDFLEAAPI